MIGTVLANLTVTEIYSVNRLLKSPVGVMTDRKNRSNWALALKMKGKTYYYVNGHEVLSDALHLVLLPKGSDYCWKCVEPGECITVEFDAPFQYDDLIGFELNDGNSLLKNICCIENNLCVPHVCSRLQCFRSLYEILMILAKSKEKDPYRSKKHEALQPALQYINENYTNGHITNDFLAGLCQMSTVYFRKSFEKAYGESPIKYLHNFRINKAKSILLSDYGNIEQVAFSVGYNSLYNFSKMFKTYTGVSPTQYVRRGEKDGLTQDVSSINLLKNTAGEVQIN